MTFQWTPDTKGLKLPSDMDDLPASFFKSSVKLFLRTTQKRKFKETREFQVRKKINSRAKIL